MITKKIANRIRQLRTEKGLTQFDVAVVGGIDPAHFGFVELGKTGFTIDTLNKILKGLEVSWAEFFNDKMFEDGNATTEVRQMVKR